MSQRNQTSLRLVKGRAKTHIAHDWESERTILGGIMMDTTFFKDVKTQCGLTRDDFHKPCHQNLWDLMETMETPDFLSVMSYVSQSDNPELLGGVAYVAALPNACPSVYGIIPRARALRTITIRRALSMVAIEIQEISTDISANADELLTKAKEAMEVTSGLRSNQTWVNADKAVEQTLLDLQNRMSSDGADGIDFGWPTLTNMVGPLRDSNLWIICARPGMGKSVLANVLALKAAQQGYGVGYISLEMPVKQCMARSLVQLSRVDAKHVRTPKLLTPEEQQKLMYAADYIAKMNLWYEFAPGLTMTRLRGMAYQLRAEAHSRGTVLAFIVVDYLGLMGGKGKNESPNDFIGSITKECKILAGELGISIIMLSQLNRKNEERTDKRPVMSDIRDSGSVEQDADVIIGIDRPSCRDPDDRPNEADIIVLKAREGETGVLVTEWHGSHMLFGDEKRQPFYG